MGIRYMRGDLFSSGAEVLVVPVNCQGVAGFGVALRCREQYPAWFQAYRQDCLDGLLRPGCPMLHFVSGRCFLSFPTKGEWWRPSRLEYIEAGLHILRSVAVPWQDSTTTVAFPKLGCGAGGLRWEDVHPLMEGYLSQLSCEVLIYL